MKRVLMLVAMLAPVTMAACGEPEVIAEAAITDESTGERVALSDLPIRLLPYDRDAIFDSLQAAYPEPEPPIPPEIVAQQQAVQEAQTEWRAAEDRWSLVRDSLRVLSDRMTQMQNQGLRGTPQYAQAFAQFNQLESQVGSLENAMNQSFARFDQLQQQTLTAADSVRIARDMWGEEAFRDFETVVAAKLTETGLDEYADTTNAQGVASFNAPEGTWWVYGRYTLPYEELYWNVPIEVTGDSVHIQLNRENASIRPVL
jgi:hypothetical protein